MTTSISIVPLNGLIYCVAVHAYTHSEWMFCKAFNDTYVCCPFYNLSFQVFMVKHLVLVYGQNYYIYFSSLLRKQDHLSAVSTHSPFEHSKFHMQLVPSLLFLNSFPLHHLCQVSITFWKVILCMKYRTRIVYYLCIRLS